MTTLTHLDAHGDVRMVDVGDKAVTTREAWAEGYVRMQPATLNLIEAGHIKKGNVLTTAHLAGVLAAKKTDQLIPLCHSLPLSAVQLEFAFEPASANSEPARLRIQSWCKTSGQTGIEMEALTAVTVAALTIYDMCKAVDKAMTIEGVRLLRKTGGKSGDYVATP